MKIELWKLQNSTFIPFCIIEILIATFMIEHVFENEYLNSLPHPSLLYLPNRAIIPAAWSAFVEPVRLFFVVRKSTK